MCPAMLVCSLNQVAGNDPCSLALSMGCLNTVQ